MTSDVWVFKEGLAIRLVAMAIWDRDADAQAVALNAMLDETQRKDGYEYRSVRRPRT